MGIFSVFSHDRTTSAEHSRFHPTNSCHLHARSIGDQIFKLRLQQGLDTVAKLRFSVSSTNMDDEDYIDESEYSEEEEALDDIELELLGLPRDRPEEEQDEAQLAVASAIPEEEPAPSIGIPQPEQEPVTPTILPTRPLPEHAASNFISALPAAVISTIASHLSITDLKHLRESALGHDETICAHLFRRTTLSPLRSDRDKLMNMAAAPHIAQHVRTLEYITLEEWLLVLDEACVDPTTKPTESVHMRNLLDDCWLPVTSTREDVCLVWDAFRPFLERALDCMPALERWSMIYGSTKAARDRTPAKVTYYLRVPEAVVTRRGAVEDGESGLDGLAREMLEQIMETRHHKREPDEPASISLSRPDTESEGKAYTKTTYFYCIPRAELRYLTKIHLSLHLIDPEDMDWAVEQLLTAQRLQHFTVSSDLTTVESGSKQAAMQDIGKKFLDAVTRQPDGWGALVHFATKNLGFPASSLARFLKMHSHTLWRLHLHEASLTKSHILALAAVEMPWLAKFTARSEDAQLCILDTHVVFARDGAPAQIHSWEFNNVGGSSAIVSVELAPRPPHKSCSSMAMDDDGAVFIEVKPFFTSWRFGPESHVARWKWGRQYPGGNVYYWRDDEDFLRSVATSTWMFRKGKGLGVYAEEPPEKWLEWTEERDYSPTPFGKAFRLFVDVQTESVGHRFETGCGIPARAILFTMKHRDILVRKGVWPESVE